ncbi:MAG: bacillithiol biosynthesis deacetylase BshB1 [bacterium]|nr:bacillithiol biosynthesis deacetylase BshB1 [bacterium]
MSDKTTLDVLAVSAHRDDTEITCGGTLIKMVDKGYTVGIVDLTQGEMGTRGSAKLRAEEAAVAAKIMGVSVRENLELPDARVENSYENKLKLVHLIRRYRPKVVILPYWKGRHPDHYTTPKLAYEACYLSGLKKLDTGAEPHRPFKIIYATMYFQDIRPSFLVDITDQFARKIEAVKAYKSQFEDIRPGEEVPFTRTDVFDVMRIRARHYGLLIQKIYAEPFFVNEQIEIDDIVQMPVRSI